MRRRDRGLRTGGTWDDGHRIAAVVDDLTPHVLDPRTVAERRAALRATAAIPYRAEALTAVI